MSETNPIFFFENEKSSYNQALTALHAKLKGDISQKIIDLANVSTKFKPNSNHDIDFKNPFKTPQTNVNAQQSNLFQNYEPFLNTVKKNQGLFSSQTHIEVKTNSTPVPYEQELSRKYGKKVIKVGDNKYQITNEPYVSNKNLQETQTQYTPKQPSRSAYSQKYIKQIDQYGHVKYIPYVAPPTNDKSKQINQNTNNQQQANPASMLVSLINKKIKDNSYNDQFWKDRGINPKTFTKKDMINQLIQQAKTDKVMPTDNSHNVFISDLNNQITKQEKTEEEHKPDPNLNIQSQQLTNSVITTFQNTIHANQIDDLSELLQTSETLKKAKLKVSNGKYVDNEFPGNYKSLLGFGDRQADVKELQSYPWLRPEQFFQQPIKVYDSIDPNDIRQGGLGDCYFLAAVSSIAEHPERLERLFLTKGYQKDGIYVVAMCIDGIWQDIVLDDLVPCSQYEKKPIYNRSNDNELWVILLEKAWAKIHGGYLNIEAGLTREALRDLTGASAKTFFNQDETYNPNQLWKFMIEADRNKWIMTAGSDDIKNGSDAYDSKIGIAGSHAYSLLGVYELQKSGNTYVQIKNTEGNPKPGVERLVKLRNPWGQNEWVQAWSDKDSRWTPELQRQLDYKVGEDGMFFMSYEDFRKYYSDFQICYFHDNYKYSALRIQSDKNEQVVMAFKVLLPGKYYLSLNQINSRKFPKNKKYCYTDLNFICCRQISTDQYDYIGGNMKTDKENWIVQDFESGIYFTIIKTPWKSFVNEFSFSVYGPGTCEIHQIDSQHLPKNFIQNVLLSHAKEYNHKEFSSMTQWGQPQIKYTSFNNQGGYAYIYFINETPDTTMIANIETLGSRNVEVMEPYTGLRPSIELKPGEHELIPFSATSIPYSLTFRILAKFNNTKMNKDIKQEVMKSDIQITKQMGGKQVKIKTYVLYHDAGFAMLYKNDTPNLVITEELEFNLENCHIDGAYGTYYSLTVQPNSERLFQVLKDENAENFNVEITKLYYKVTEKQ